MHQNALLGSCCLARDWFWLVSAPEPNHAPDQSCRDVWSAWHTVGALQKDDAGDEEVDPPAARAVVEDIGGAPANLDEDAPPDVAPEDRQEICLPAAAVTRVLARAAERAAAGSPGRPRDVDKDIRAVAQTFGSVLDELASSHPTRPRQNRHLGAEVHDQLAHQVEAARRAR